MNKDVVKNNNTHYCVNDQKENIELSKQNEIIKPEKIKTKSSGKKNNMLRFKLSKKHLTNKLLSHCRCIFSNIEIKKYIKNQDINKMNDQIDKEKASKKNNNINDFSFSNSNSNNNNRSKSLNDSKNKKQNNISFSEYNNKKELKEQATNTYSNLNINATNDNNNNNNENNNNDNDANNIYNSTPKINSKRNFNKEKYYHILDNNKKEFKKHNNQLNEKNEKYNIVDINLKPINKRTINMCTQSKMLITNLEKNSAKNIFSDSKYIKDILIDNNNIQNYNEMNKNQYKLNFYNDIYNYNIIQSILQNKSNFFNIKLFPFNTRNMLNDNNVLYMNNFNSFSIRELYRNLNNCNSTYSSHSPLGNKNKRNNRKKKVKKLFELKISKEDNDNNNNIKKKFNLTNFEYQLNKKKLVFENMLLNKKKTNYNDFKHKHEDKYFKRKKIKGNCFNNFLKKKDDNIIIKDDILDIGLTNSSSQIKIFNKHNLNKIIDNKNNKNKIAITKTPNENKKFMLKINNTTYNNGLFSLIKKDK